jgi:hypothetical protein
LSLGGKLSLQGKIRAQKNLHSHEEGNEGEQKNWTTSSLILSLARQSPMSRDTGLDEREKAGLLAPRSFY